MRPSRKNDILAAAARVVQQQGIAAVTYETVAAESGFTKGGLVYHFPSREDLVVSLHEYLAAQWEAGMAVAAGKSNEQATEIERLQGYIRASTTSATRAELLLLLEGTTTDEHAAPWNRVLARWTQPPPRDVEDTEAVDRFIARLAADGLWVYESLSLDALDPEFRRMLANLIAARISNTPPT